MITIDLSGKKIIITGALGAISEYIVKKLIEAGAFLILTDIIPMQAAKGKIKKWNLPPNSYEYKKMDVTIPENVDMVIKETFQAYPELDSAIGHAGGCELHFFKETKAEEFDRIFKFNFLGQTYFARALLKEWTKRTIPGHLIFTSSYVAKVPHQGIPSYASAKAALENFAKCLALEYAEQKIRINLVSPGNVAAGSSLKVFQEDENYRDMVLRVTPLKRQNDPEAIANAFLFMCSPLANELNGHILDVDLGVSIPKIG
ncbi:MAG: SDR family oxidoreductase [Bacteroidetes bacterium]|nr:SDR family oxidoreductase [Bacteroidota bacterium]